MKRLYIVRDANKESLSGLKVVDENDDKVGVVIDTKNITVKLDVKIDFAVNSKEIKPLGNKS